MVGRKNFTKLNLKENATEFPYRIQCCRLGFGPREKLLPLPPPPPPPVAPTYSYESHPINSYSSGEPNQAYLNSAYSSSSDANFTKPLPIAGLGGPFDDIAVKTQTLLVDANGVAINSNKASLVSNSRRLNVN